MKIAKVIKNGQVRWRLSYMENRKQVRRFFKSKSGAEEAMAGMVDERRLYGETWLKLTGQERAEIMEAVYRAQAGSYGLLEACVAYERTQARTASVSVQVAVAECLESKTRQGLRRESLAKLRQNLSRLAISFRDRPVSSLDASELETWLHGSNYKPATIKSHRTDLQTFCSYCHDRRWMDVNPVKAIPVPMMEDRPPAILTVDQCKSLMEAVKENDNNMAGYFSLCLFCGIRPAEVLRLTPEHVHLDDKYVEVPGPRAKTRQRRIVEMSENAIAWCWVGLELPPKNWRKRFDAVRVLAKLTDAWSHDCMRHSFASYHLAAYGSADVTATQLGHRSTEMLFRHYRELARREDGLAFFAILPAQTADRI